MTRVFPETVLRGHKGEVQCLCFGDGERALFSGDSRGEVHAWNLQTARSTKTVCHSGNAGVIQLQRAGADLLASQGRDGEIRLWHTAPEGTLRLAGAVPGTGFHFCRCRTQSFAEDAAQVPAHCLASYDSEAHAFRLWDLRQRRHATSAQHSSDYGLAMCCELMPCSQPALLAGCVASLQFHCLRFAGDSNLCFLRSAACRLPSPLRDAPVTRSAARRAGMCSPGICGKRQHPLRFFS